MNYREEYERWLASDALTPEERRELEAIRGDDQEIRERFYAPLSFGTAGLRGVMGAGIRRMNARVVRQATRALGSLILAEGGEAAAAGAVVCCDCRNHSREYAVDAARVLAAMGVHVRLFEALRPTPELSFAIRLHGAAAGINITASHNPKEYNGYKVYWSDGAQLPPERAETVARAMAELDILDPVPMAPEDDPGIEIIGRETDEAFLRAALSQSVCPEAAAKAALRIVYTPFNGAGAKLVPEALRRMGVRELLCVEEQMAPDGDFPTCKNPNPEFEAGFERALILAREKDADLIIGTDPDADRLGLMVKTGPGEYRLLTGNEVGVLFLDYLLTAKAERGTLPERPVALKSIVSSEMARAVAERHGAEMEDTFTGFKFLAERMKLHEKDGKHVIFAFEEAIGYAFGDAVRDKDAVTAALMAAEMASYHALRGKTLPERLEELYALLGHREEETVSLVMPGVDGLERMGKLMERLRRTPPASLAGERVRRVRDYLGGEARDGEGNREALPMRGADMLYFDLADGSAFIVRPSGTEPKVKCYLQVRGASRGECEKKRAALAAYARSLAEA
ncbi:MAG: phospho-sugar mutase [Oscillospiraceae bacterium]|nr:phospho-sugar mutase [Oscillospiraceae bacterium]